MEFLRHLLLFIHFVSFAALLGSLLGQINSPERVVNTVTAWGARLALLAGLLLVGVLEADDFDVNHAKVGTKLVIALVVVGLVEANRKRGKLADGLYFGLIGLTALNVAVAVFWR